MVFQVANEDACLYLSREHGASRGLDEKRDHAICLIKDESRASKPSCPVKFAEPAITRCVQSECTRLTHFMAVLSPEVRDMKDRPSLVDMKYLHDSGEHSDNS